MTKLGNCFLLAVAVILCGCSNLTAIETLTRQDVADDYTFEYQAPYADVLNATTTAISELGWISKKVSETTEGRSSDDLFLFALAGIHSFGFSDNDAAWQSVEPPESASKITFVQARTPATLTSFGAHIYATVYSVDDAVGIKLSASTNQRAEKYKIYDYLDSLRENIDLIIEAEGQEN